MELTISRKSISAAAAYAAVGGAVANGRLLDKAAVAAVVDASGDLVALLRADGAFKASIGIAQDKAYTAAVFGLATDDLSNALIANPTLHQGIGQRPGVILFAGGLPIIVNGEVIGGIGVSGGTEEDDRACARAGLASLGLA
ncbi:heme-binding protein [Rhodoblastus acidophilus]|uniref:Heme-binding protein n=1 Tax=Candidatus Rhodoblastus alkanivorans TaxID=2954117 RepID=A0ABS9Z4U3_9HYPH|nr:heme-binding protein [Candidatus Rhodoblastus alkanivorans]MCI4682400.1 heme-binding protein [Candidatus Rhodoblastus alkanivorans]MDI4639705.1 heme-binding protein [Rhodoblastus acidophilus]